MPETLTILAIIGLGWGAIIFSRQWKRYQIRRTGTRIIAEVIQVRYLQDSIVKDNLYFPKTVPQVSTGWQYEITAKGTDPHTQQILIISSGIKKGLPSTRQGDHLAAYISPRGNYLELP